jgi:uncharacterized membrane protein YuzA (DUF378 family)
MKNTAIRLFMISMLLLVVGGLNWGYAAFNKRDLVSTLFGKRAWIVYVLVALAALYIGFARDSYLPFLGPAAFPCALLKDQVPEGATVEVPVHVHPGAKVLYWAAEPANEDLKTLQDWRHAYTSYRNAGVATANESGVATLRVRKPQGYTVGLGKELAPHIHYRVCDENGIMVGRVETVFSEEQEKDLKAAVEAFKVSKDMLPPPEEHVVEDGVEETQGGTEEREEESEEVEPFVNYAPAAFSSEQKIAEPTDNALYILREETEKKMVTDEFGTPEYPHPVGAEYDQAFGLRIRQ